MALTFSTRKETAAKRARERGGDFNARRGGEVLDQFISDTNGRRRRRAETVRTEAFCVEASRTCNYSKQLGEKCRFKDFEISLALHLDYNIPIWHTPFLT